MQSESASVPQVSKPSRKKRPILLYVLGGIALLAIIYFAQLYVFSPLANLWTFDIEVAGSLSWSPDGKLLAVSGDGLNIIDATTGRIVLHNPTTDYAQAVAWSPDGSRLAASTEGGEVVIWDASGLPNGGSLAELHRFKAYDETAWSLAWSPDSRQLATISSGDENLVIIWDAQTAEPVWRYKDAYLGFNLKWSPDGSTLAAGAVSSISLLDVQLQDWSDSLPDTALPGQTGIINDLDWSYDNQQIAYGYWGWGLSGGMGIIDVASGRVVSSFPTDRMVENVDWSPAYPLIALGINPNNILGSRGELYVYDTTTQVRRLVPQSTTSIEDLKWSPDGGLLAVSSFYEGNVTIWRLTIWYGGS